MIRNLLLTFFAVAFTGYFSYSQISCTNATYRTLTDYTNTTDNDSLFIICSGQTATLVATPPSGTPGWDFQWQQFSATGNLWAPLTTQSGVPSSTQSNLQPGGYRCVITDGNGTEVGAFIVWVSRINTNPSVSVNAIPDGCGPVQLIGQVNNGSVTPYYNPPSASLDPSSMLIVNEDTEITVCFTGTHSWVSDLGFYLMGPAECGYPIVSLSPSPDLTGQGVVCNGNDNFNNLCFSTESTTNFDPCNANWDLDGWIEGVQSNYTGTFGSYGPPSSPNAIDWSPLYGCNASMAGWAVQVYDCTSLDTGALTGASLSFSGPSQGGAVVSYSYNTQSGFNSAINDNSCTPQTASIFEVPAPPPAAIYFQYGYQWTANPAFTIPNNTSSLNITLNPGPTVDTEFTLSITGNNPGAICGGSASASRSYHFSAGEQSVITTAVTSYCLSSSTVNLTANMSGGTWSGTGITSASNGTFNPTQAGVGEHVITYTPSNPCNLPSTITLTVGENIPIVVTPVTPVCISDEAFQLQVDATGGTWSGEGITDINLGMFDPSVAGQGSHLVTYHVPGICEAIGMTTIVVETPGVLTVNAPESICANVQSLTLTASSPGGTWSGNGIIDEASGVFSPAQAGVGNVVITYTQTAGCQSIGTATINVVPVPVVSVGENVFLCPGESVTLTATGAQSYSWQPSDGLNNTSSSSVIASPQTTTTYMVIGTANGCSGTGNVTVIVHGSPQMTVNGPFFLCPGETAQLNASGVSSYAWNNGSTLSSSTVSNPVASPTQTTTYTVIGTDNNGCTAEASILVEVMNIHFTADPAEGLAPLDVEFTNYSDGSIFSWDFGNGETAITHTADENAQTTYLADGTYHVILTAGSGANSCTGEISVWVYSGASIDIIPNIVTPDGSGKNDVFRIKQNNLKTLDITIYNRYGNVVGNIDTPNGYWDARSHSDGTYYYILKAEGIDNSIFERSGSFTVVR